MDLFFTLSLVLAHALALARVFALALSLPQALALALALILALALAFLDFLADGLGVKKVGIRKFVLVLLVFVPPFLISMVNLGIFLKALSYAGGISCAILFGIYPPLMVWIGRYKKGHTTGQQIPGGRVFLSFLIVLMVAELLIEVAPGLFK